MELRAVVDRVERRLKAVEKSAAAASREAGLSEDAIRNMKRALEGGGRKGVSTATISALAPVLRTSMGWLLNGEGSEDAQTVAPAGGVGVWGKIGARAEVHPFTDYSSDPMYEIELPPTVDPTRQYVGFEIEGFSMPPATPGWVVLFRQAEFSPNDFINSPCMVDTEDGRRLFKVLRRGYTEDRYNLESWDGTPLIEDIEVVRALPFVAMTPGRNAR